MNIAIIGAAYTGLKAAKILTAQGHTVTVTTTQEKRVAPLKEVADNVIVMVGSDREKMRALLTGQDIVLMTVAGGMVERDGKTVMDPELYRDAYLGTAQSLVESLDAAPNLKQIIFTSSLNAYGDAGGVTPVVEDTPSHPQGPFQSVYVETEDVLLGAQSETLNVAIYRTGTIYGPGVMRGLNDSAKGMTMQPIPFDGDSDVMIVHRDDVVGALVFGIKHNVSGRYNVFNDTTDSKKEFFAKVCDREGYGAIEWLNLSPGPRQVSNQKLKDLGFRYLDPFSERDGDELL